jgi:hypothetical protein
MKYVAISMKSISLDRQLCQDPSEESYNEKYGIVMYETTLLTVGVS